MWSHLLSLFEEPCDFSLCSSVLEAGAEAIPHRQPFLKTKTGGVFPLTDPNLRSEKPRFAFEHCTNLGKFRAVLEKTK